MSVSDITNIYGDEQAWVLNIEDFGSENDSSAPVTNTTVRGLVGGKVQHLLANGCSDIGHVVLTINGASGETFTTRSRGVIDLTYIGAARVQNAYINDEVDAPAVFAAKSPSMMILNSSLRTAADHVARIFRTVGITISQCNIAPAGSSTVQNGIYIRAQDGNSQRILILGNNITGGSGSATLASAGIVLAQNGAAIDTGIVKNNISQNGVDGADLGNPAIVTDNISP